MITLEQYINQHDDLATCDPQIQINSTQLLQRVNAFLQAYEVATGNDVEEMRSGLRPPAVNACTPGASKTSKHMTGEGVDTGDVSGKLNDWAMTEKGTEMLVACMLWHEHPRDTPTWCHLQSQPPRSGNRHFYAK